MCYPLYKIYYDQILILSCYIHVVTDSSDYSLIWAAWECSVCLMIIRWYPIKVFGLSVMLFACQPSWNNSVGRASGLPDLTLLWHDSSWFCPTNASHVCGRDGMAAMLAAKRSAGVTPEVFLREHVTHMPPPSWNKAAYSGFETQRRRH